MLGVLLTTAATFLIALAVVLLGSAPQGNAIVGLAVVLAFAAAMFSLVARYVTPRQIVGRVVAFTVAALLLAGVVWATSARDDALFLARDMAWGESDVFDYQKFPSRAVENGAPVFKFNHEDDQCCESLLSQRKAASGDQRECRDVERERRDVRPHATDAGEEGSSDAGRP
jgi:hypothetical protein